MKKLLLIIIACLLYANYASWSTKDEEAACLLSDVLRNCMDDSIIGERVQAIYDSYTTDFGSLGFSKLHKEDLEEYYWCY